MFLFRFAQSPDLLTLLMILATGIGYALATYGIKLASHVVSPPAILLTATGFLLAILAEILLLRRVDLSIAYLSVIAVESILVLTLAIVLGDQLTGAQLAGSVLVIVGTWMISV